MTDLNQRFTDLADFVSERMGYWPVTAFFVVLILLWLASGPFFGFSDTWQLMVNTPTTIIELFIGFLLAAASNRAERRGRLMQEHTHTLVEREENEIEEGDKHLQGIGERLERLEQLILGQRCQFCGKNGYGDHF